MDKRSLGKFKKALLAERAKIQENIGSGIKHLIVNPEDLKAEEDASSVNMQSSITVKLETRQYGYFKKIEEAFSRMENGTYGDCQECGCAIEAARLLARPAAEFCIDCQEFLERQKQAKRNNRLRMLQSDEKDEASGV